MIASMRVLPQIGPYQISRRCFVGEAIPVTPRNGDGLVECHALVCNCVAVVRRVMARRGLLFPTMRRTKVSELVPAIGGESPTNGAKEAIEAEIPFIVEVTIQGTADLLFHRWNCESVAEKAASKKGSVAKKTDDINSYVYKDEKGFMCLPGEYLRMSIIGASKFRQDPRSPRKSAMDLFKAAIISMTPLASLGTKDWDYLDKRRVVIQRSAITRSRPAMKSGWTATIQLLNNLPEYISPSLLNEVIGQAGKLIGVGDFRPSFGRFQIVSFKLIDLD